MSERDKFAIMVPESETIEEMSLELSMMGQGYEETPREAYTSGLDGVGTVIVVGGPVKANIRGSMTKVSQVNGRSLD